MTQGSTTVSIPQADGDGQPLGEYVQSRQSRTVNATAVSGVALMLSKARSVQRAETLVTWSEVSPEEQRDLMLDAARAINGQDPTKSRRAHDLALERAESVLAEEGAIDNAQARHLARRIAAEAMLTYRLALEGSLETPKSAGGVQ